MKIFLVFNPVSGRGRGLQLAEALQSRFLADGHVVQCEPSQSSEHARALAAALPRDADVFAVLGGDGTLNAVVNGLTRDIPVLACPAGTANVMARELGLPRAPAACAALLRSMHLTRVDLGLANGRKFFLMCSAGFDADIIHRLAAGRRGPISPLSYLRPGLGALQNYSHPALRVLVGGKPVFEGRGTVIAANLSGYAGLFQIAPARYDDGRFDLVVLPAERSASYVGHLWRLFTGGHLQGRGVLYQRTECLRIESEGGCPVQVDGEPSGMAPCDISLSPQSLRLITPPPLHPATEAVAVPAAGS